MAGVVALCAPDPSRACRAVVNRRMRIRFACQSQALSREWYDVWRDVFQAGVCAAGLALVLTLPPRAARPPAKLAPPPKREAEARGDGAVKA